MADQAPSTPATQLSGLEKFSQQVFKNSQGAYTLDDFEYMDDTPLFSLGCYTVTAGTIAGDLNLFTTPAGQSGQGWPQATFPQLGDAETNLQKGQADGKFPANQAYVGIAGGFDVFQIPADDNGTLTQLGGIPVTDAADLHQILSGLTWSWNIGGRQSPTIQYEPLKAWPCSMGVWGIGAAGAVQAASNGGPLSQMRKFPFPLMFPPQISAELKVKVSRAPTAFNSINNGSLIVVGMHMRGYMVTKVK